MNRSLSRTKQNTVLAALCLLTLTVAAVTAKATLLQRDGFGTWFTHPLALNSVDMDKAAAQAASIEPGT